MVNIETAWAEKRRAASAPLSVVSTLTEAEAHQRVRWVHDHFLEDHRANPGAQRVWRTDLFDQLWGRQAEPASLLDGYVENRQDARDYLARTAMESWCERTADLVVASAVDEMMLDPTSRRRLVVAVAAAAQRAALTLKRWALGESADGVADCPTQTFKSTEQAKTLKGVQLTALLDGWAAEKRPAARTVYEWTRVLKQFEKHLGHGDASRIAAEDVIAWKASMVEAGLAAKTIRDAKLAPLRAVLRWGADNRKIPQNPAERVTIDIKQRPAEGKRSFTEDEAAIILRAAAKSIDPVKRWVPLLCAYSGARLSEVCQLRVMDVRIIDGVHRMAFDPDAGSLKTRSSERAVPLHFAIIDAGFLDYVRTVGAGSLFPSLPPNIFGKRGRERHEGAGPVGPLARPDR